MTQPEPTTRTPTRVGSHTAAWRSLGQSAEHATPTEPQPEPTVEPLPQQLRYLFGHSLNVSWDKLPTGDRAYWEQQAAAVRRAVAVPEPLSDAERQFLTFALDQAAEEMSLRDGFTDEDEAALASLRKLAAGEQQDEPTNSDFFSGAELHDMDRADEYAMDAADDDAAAGEQS